MNKPRIFISYAQFDDEFERGALRRLRDELTNTLRAISGHEIFLFQEDSGVEIGQPVEDRIDHALREAVVLVPILTPSFFTDELCQKILTNFLERERQLGRDDLVLAMHYRQVPDLEDVNNTNNHLIRAIAPRRILDWQSLRGKEFSDHHVRSELEQLARRIVNLLRELEPHRHNASIDRTLLHKSLLKLDYDEQVEEFRRFIEGGHPVGAFLVHGDEHHGQTWLVNRLIRQHFPYGTEKKTIGLKRVSRKNDINSLWRELGKHVGPKLNPDLPDIISQFVALCSDRHFVLILKEIHKIEPYFEQFITEFWCPLVDEIQSTVPRNHGSRLIMFLVDTCGHLSTHSTICNNHLNPTWQPHEPIRLPKIVPLSNSTLLSWMQREIEDLPQVLTAQSAQAIQDILEISDGIPEDVMDEICLRCGYDWEENMYE